MNPADEPVTLRPMTEADLVMLHERPSLSEVLEHYRPRVLGEEPVSMVVAMLGSEPIGFAQSYTALGCGDGWWEEETDPGVRGIDQSLANPMQLNQGLGTRLVRALVERLFADPAVTKIQTDPAPANRRAIRCYEKAGFVQERVIVTPDGPAVYMVLTRQAFERDRRSA
jgi:aminoglycoside 6'-N-acetyltransferase-1b/aminoglycoside 6'-N-acetyltransferase-2